MRCAVVLTLDERIMPAANADSSRRLYLRHCLPAADIAGSGAPRTKSKSQLFARQPLAEKAPWFLADSCLPAHAFTTLASYPMVYCHAPPQDALKSCSPAQPKLQAARHRMRQLWQMQPQFASWRPVSALYGARRCGQQCPHRACKSPAHEVTLSAAMIALKRSACSERFTHL